MIGKYVLPIKASDFVLGETTSEYTQDGGFSPSSFNINPLLIPGVIKACAPVSNQSTNISGNIIASSEDSQSSGANNRIFVDDAANYYYWNGSAMTKQKTGTATTHYVIGKTDMASFAQNSYATLDNDIAQVNTSGSWTLTESWWVTTKGKSALDSTVPHPLLVFENFLWVGPPSKSEILVFIAIPDVNALQRAVP